MPTRDPEKQKIWSRRWYEKNRDKVIATSARQKLSLREKYKAYKATLSCQYCGYNECPEALDFHHVVHSPDNEKVYKLAGHGRFRAAMEEIKKCVVLCSNCHRRLHNDEEFEKAVMKKVKRVVRKISQRIS
jgi:hypothetical protein